MKDVQLPVNPPVLPMLAKRVGELPEGDHWIFEPKWDGFRALIFRDGAEILIQSRDEKPLNRYFPEVVEALLAALPARCVLDGEIVIAQDSGLDFDSLQLRLHPAASRVKLLSQQIPASVVFFDLLCLGDRDLRGEPVYRRPKGFVNAPPFFLYSGRAVFDRTTGAGLWPHKNCDPGRNCRRVERKKGNGRYRRPVVVRPARTRYDRARKSHSVYRKRIGQNESGNKNPAMDRYG